MAYGPENSVRVAEVSKRKRVIRPARSLMYRGTLLRYSTFEKLWSDLQEANNTWIPEIDGKRWVGNLSDEVIGIRRECLNRLLSGIISNKVSTGDSILPRYFRKGKAAPREPTEDNAKVEEDDDDDDEMLPVSVPSYEVRRNETAKDAVADAAEAPKPTTSSAAAPRLVTVDSDEDDTQPKRFYTSKEEKKAERDEALKEKKRKAEERQERLAKKVMERSFTHDKYRQFDLCCIICYCETHRRKSKDV